jgi:hypothetical protein
MINDPEGGLVTGLNLSFIRKVYFVSALLTIFVCAYIYIRYGFYLSLGVMAGGLFGIINMMLLGRVVTSLIHNGPLDPIEVLISAFVKFPLALGIIFIVLWKGYVDPLGFLIGFPITLVAAILTVIAHYYMGSGRRIIKEEEPGCSH